MPDDLAPPRADTEAIWKRAWTITLAAAVLVVPAGAAVAAPIAGELQSRLEAVHAAGMPGVFAEVRDGRRTWTPTSGVIDVRTQRPVRDGLRHRVGSSDPDTATATRSTAGPLMVDRSSPQVLSARP